MIVRASAVLAALAASLVCFSTASSQAGPPHRHGRHHFRHHHFGHHHYHHDHFHHDHWFDGPRFSLFIGTRPSLAIAPPPPVAYVPGPPPGYVAVQLGGVTYYRHGHVYYRQTILDGAPVYYVATPPQVLAVPQATPSAAPDQAPAAQPAATPAPVPDLVSTPTPTNAPVLVPPPAAAAPAPPDPNVVLVNGKRYLKTDPAPQAFQMPATPTLPAPAQSRPAVGAVVDELPVGATPDARGGTTYFRAGDVYYLRINVSGQMKYVVVEPS